MGRRVKVVQGRQWDAGLVDRAPRPDVADKGSRPRPPLASDARVEPDVGGRAPGYR